MAHVVKDRVMETTATTGTGSLTLAGAIVGYQSFSTIGNGNTTYYAILGGSEWEVGVGTWSTGGTLSRDTVLESSNSGSLVNFSAGTKNVICTYPAERSVDSNGTGATGTWGISISGNAATATKLSATNWVVEEVSGVLYFKYGGVNKAKMDSSGNLTLAGNLIAAGTV